VVIQICGGSVGGSHLQWEGRQPNIQWLSIVKSNRELSERAEDLLQWLGGVQPAAACTMRLSHAMDRISWLSDHMPFCTGKLFLQMSGWGRLDFLVGGRV
jgi:hypothetical protein